MCARKAQNPRTHPAAERGADRWTPAPYAPDELLRALVDEGMAGEVSHDRQNVLGKCQRLVEGDVDVTFGLSGMTRYTRDEVVALVDRATRFDAGAGLFEGPTIIDPVPVLEMLEAMGDRLALACERGESMVFATGHPVGLLQLYMALAREVAARGVKLLRPGEGEVWREWGHRRTVRYLGGVAVLTDRASSFHTHSPEAMRRMLADARPDLVVGDHGYAGAAIEAGVETLAVTDVNDPAVLVAQSEGRVAVVVTMDDNVLPEKYWPCLSRGNRIDRS